MIAGLTRGGGGGRRHSSFLCRIVANRRMFCSDVTLEDRENPPRSKQFYEENGIKRNYFYFMDNRGQLFLEETKRRNIATAMKDPKFLDFTIRNMKPNDTQNFKEMPSISLYGKEINYIAHADQLSPFTFKNIIVGDDDTSHLVYAGSLSQPFDPEQLAFHPDTGRVYHRITKHRHYSGGYGLLHPHLCLDLSENIVHDDNSDEFTLHVNDKAYILRIFD